MRSESASSTRSRRALLGAITIGIGTCGALISGEMALRLYDYLQGVDPPFTHNLPDTLAVPNGYFNFDLRRGLSLSWDSRSPRRVSINRWGFRGADYDPIKPAGVLRIFCFGGSSTFDPFVSDEDTWSARLGSELAGATDRPVESINAGRYGYTTSEILGLFYHRALRHDPDALVLYSTFNDGRVRVSPYYGRDDGPQLYGNPLVAALQTRSVLFTFFDFRLRNVWPTAPYWSRLVPNSAPGAPVPAEHLAFLADDQRRLRFLAALYARNVRSIVRLARDSGVAVLLATQVVDSRSRKPEDALIEDTLRRLAAEEDVPLVDLQRLSPSDPKAAGLLATYVHLTPAGCRFVASKIAEGLAAHLHRPPGADEQAAPPQ